MRTLPSQLLAAQQSASAEPHVDVVVENTIAGLTRLDFTQLDVTSQPIAKHDVAVAGDGSVTRVRMESGTVKQQRVTSPGSGPWTSWNNLATGKGAQVAAAAKGARVAVAYVDAAGTGIKLRESADNGATYAAEQAVVTAGAAVADLAVAYKSGSGDLAIAWVTATGVHIIRRVSGAFGSVSSVTSGLASMNGVAMTYGFDWDIVLTGVESATSKPSLWTVVFGDGNDAPAATWGTLYPQQQAESDAQVTYKAPSIVFTDSYRINFVEADAFTGGATRVYRTSVHPAMTFVAGPFTLRSPLPVNYGGAEGLAIAADAGGAGYVYESAPDAVSRAPQSSLTATLTGDVLAIEIEEREDGVRGWVEIDNADGAWAGPPAPVAPGNLIAVSWGYRTASGLQASRMCDLSIAAIEHRRTGGVSTMRLYLDSGWEVLRRNRQRTQVVHTSDSYLAVLVRIFSRAGLQLQSDGVSTRATAVTPQFTVHPQTSGFESASRALEMLPDRIRMRPNAAAVISEPSASDPADYVFGAAHPLRDLRFRREPPAVSEAQALGAGAFGEAIDFAYAQHGIGTREQQRDASSATGGAAAATASAHLRQRALDADAGIIVVPPNCGQEILDAVEIDDALIAPDAIRRRVRGIRWRYDRRRGIYDQELRLSAM